MPKINYVKLKPIFKLFSEIKLVYLFGSRAAGKQGPLSDYDFAIYLDSGDKRKMLDIKLSLYHLLGRALKTDKIDVVIFNLTGQSELKYNIINEGKIIYEIEPYRLSLEPRVLNEYFDFRAGLLRHKLTKIHL